MLFYIIHIIIVSGTFTRDKRLQLPLNCDQCKSRVVKIPCFCFKSKINKTLFKREYTFNFRIQNAFKIAECKDNKISLRNCRLHFTFIFKYVGQTFRQIKRRRYATMWRRFWPINRISFEFPYGFQERHVIYVFLNGL